jgi:hypothetical protein
MNWGSSQKLSWRAFVNIDGDFRVNLFISIPQFMKETVLDTSLISPHYQQILKKIKIYMQIARKLCCTLALKSLGSSILVINERLKNHAYSPFSSD